MQLPDSPPNAANIDDRQLRRTFRRNLKLLRAPTAVAALKADHLILLNAILGAAVRDLCAADPAAPVRPFKPTPEQIWRPKERGADGRRVSAMMVFQQGFGCLPFEERPFAHQIRQHPLTRPLYDGLCVKLSRNRKAGLKPDGLNDLFPIHPQATALGGAMRRSEIGLSAPASLAP